MQRGFNMSQIDVFFDQMNTNCKSTTQHIARFKKPILVAGMQERLRRLVMRKAAQRQQQ